MSSEELKTNVKRTVRLDRGVGGEVTLSKHFHAPGIGRLRDGVRARSEARALAEAARRGLPVPEVLGLERNGASWTLRLQWIPHARTLDEVTGGLDITAPPHAPGGRTRVHRLARAIGSLLAAIEASGLQHPDPHAQNVLVDGADKLWLVDLARSRFVRPSAAGFERTLVLACARFRDLSTRRFRALVFRAYLRARSASFPAPDPASVERRAMEKQREDVARRVRVWRRTSSLTAVDEGPPRTVRALEMGEGPEPGWCTQRLDCSRSEADAIWAHLVRARMHRLPAVRPRRLALSPPYFVEFDIPAQGAGEPDEPACEALRVALAARGLRLHGSPIAAPDGAALIPPRGDLLPMEGS
ncbi:MAG: hypothetical protein ISQ11_08610 [Planctomycetes bacterium]|nr:hypothetical protein [Planctomycetota bacterium]